MIRFDGVTISYGERPVVTNIDLAVEEGELCVLVGATGRGKSTLLGAVNGLVPRFTGGSLSGSVTVAGHDTSEHLPRDLAEVVGFVPQDPASGFVADIVEDELAYGLEQLGVAPQIMRKRVEETLDLLGLADLRRRALTSLSGGEQQRVAIGAVLTTHPKVLVLDEPTSALDPSAAEDVLAAVQRIVHDLGVTVLLAEHRLERVVQYADRIALLDDDGRLVHGEPPDVMRISNVVPPVVELGRVAGWDPPPLSVRDARRMAAPLRDVLGEPSTVGRGPTTSTLVRSRDVSVLHAAVVALRHVSIDLAGGEVVALMGRNGSGKSSLLWALQGSGRRDGGTVEVDGVDVSRLDARNARRKVGLVPQSPTDLLYLETVDDECRQADTDAGAGPGTTRTILDRLVGGIGGAVHPRDLSEGQRLALVLAIQLAASPQVVLLDEPTRGLDYAGKRALSGVLTDLATLGHAVMVATHDVEFAASVASRVVVLAEGEIVADGPAGEVVLSSPVFAPQVAKVLAPAAWLTVEQVASALEPTS